MVLGLLDPNTKFPTSRCYSHPFHRYPLLLAAGHIPPHIWSSTQTPLFSTLTPGQLPQETSRSLGFEQKGQDTMIPDARSEDNIHAPTQWSGS